jgi:hypothetical protein
MNNFEALFLSIAISVGVFLLLREVFCWYFKINKRLSVLVDIKAELVKMNEPKALVSGVASVVGIGGKLGNGMESK